MPEHLWFPAPSPPPTSKQGWLLHRSSAEPPAHRREKPRDSGPKSLHLQLVTTSMLSEMQSLDPPRLHAQHLPPIRILGPFVCLWKLTSMEVTARDES